MERFLSHIPQTVAPHHRHDHLLLCLVAIDEREKDVGRLRLLGILVVEGFTRESVQQCLSYIPDEFLSIE